MNNKITQIGYLNRKVIEILSLSVEPAKIFIGSDNIEHIKSKHPHDYETYFDEMPQILNSPDYVGINNKDSSIEYIKDFRINGEYVKVAVRATHTSNIWFVRSMYTMSDRKIDNYIKKNRLKKL